MWILFRREDFVSSCSDFSHWMKIYADFFHFVLFPVRKRNILCIVHRVIRVSSRTYGTTHRSTEGWTEASTDIWKNGHMQIRTSEKMDICKYGNVEEWTDAGTDRWRDGLKAYANTDIWKDGHIWKYEHMEGWTDTLTDTCKRWRDYFKIGTDVI